MKDGHKGFMHCIIGAIILSINLCLFTPMCTMSTFACPGGCPPCSPALIEFPGSWIVNLGLFIIGFIFIIKGCILIQKNVKVDVIIK